MSLQNNKFALKRLKSKNTLDALFRNKNGHNTKSLILKVLKKEKASFLLAGVSVPKKNFKKAVDRNKIKRQLRQGLKNIEHKLPFGGSCMLIYKGKKVPLTAEIIDETEALFFKQKT
jgi:ribonuclease P protein component